MAKYPIITFDGPSGVGKGTLSGAVARKLGWQLLDSGALYRIVAWYAMQNGWYPEQSDDVDKASEAARELDIRFISNELGATKVYCQQQEVTHDIRQPLISSAASKWAVLPRIRSALLDRQRMFATNRGLIADGRDMGTTIFPKAGLKFYVIASAKERAKRRYFQLFGENKSLSDNENNDTLTQIYRDIVARDERDASRQASPLKPADDAIHIDTTGETIAESLEKVFSYVRRKGWLNANDGPL